MTARTSIGDMNMKSKTKPATTIDKMEKYCNAHGVAAARHAADGLWLFVKANTPRGARLLTHRFRLETDRLLSVESAIALPMDIQALKTKKSLQKVITPFSAADEKFKYPAVTRLFRGAAATLTDALIGDIVA